MNDLTNQSLFKVSSLIVITALLMACGGNSSEKIDEESTHQIAEQTDSVNQDEHNTLYFESKAKSLGLHHEWDLIDLDVESTVASSYNASGGIAVGDYDQDGDIDLFITSGNKSASKLYQKQTDGSFVDKAELAGVQLTGIYSGPSFADSDNDGDLDLFVGGMGKTTSKLFINQGNGTFIEGMAPNISKEYTLSSSFADYNNDGYLDLAVSHYASTLTNDPEHLWLNTGNNIFESVSSSTDLINTSLNGESNSIALDLTFTPNFSDIDNNGHLDLLMASDYNTSALLFNTGAGYFEEKSTNLNLKIRDLQGMGAVVADIDNDGDLDWFVTSIIEFEEQTGSLKYSGNKLFSNNGDGSFRDISYQSNIYNGGWGWSACIADFNNDGLLDIFNTNGWNLPSSVTGKYESHDNDTIKLFLATESGQYIETNTEIGLSDKGQGRAVVCFDNDDDGDIDILLSNHDTNLNALIFYENKYNSGNYLKIDLRSKQGNTFAIGARVYVKTALNEQMREVNINSNFTSQTPSQLHFGLADNHIIEQIRIFWPNGELQNLTDISVNQTLLITQP